MKKIKRLAFRAFFGLEIILFAQMYLFGINGLQTIWQVQHEIMGVKKQIKEVSQEVVQLGQEKEAWETNDFFKEKLAREQLHMARMDEEIFYID